MKRRKHSSALTYVTALLLAFLLCVSGTVGTAFATPADDIPPEMLDNSILRALEYIGYDVQKQKDMGTIYIHYGLGMYNNYRSEYNQVTPNIPYGAGATGKETIVDSSTVTGKAPYIDYFKSNGLVCASFVAYYYLNYLPNIEGVDTSAILDAVNAAGGNTKGVLTWRTAMNSLVASGAVEKVGTSSSNAQWDRMVPGDLILFKSSTAANAHAAIYVGIYNGRHFMIHMVNATRGIEISCVEISEWPVSLEPGDDNLVIPIDGTSILEADGFYHIVSNGSLTIRKTSSDTSVTDGNSNYSLAGAVYGVYSDPDCNTLVGTLTTNASGETEALSVAGGTYYVKEQTAPDNFDLDTTVYTVNVTAGQDAVLDVTDAPQTGTIQLVKSSADPSITNGNSNYSLEGAVYGVYSDNACTQLATTLTTDAQGKAASGQLAYRQYWVKEQTPPKGFEKDNTVYPVTVNSTTAVSLNVTETPQTGKIQIIKSSANPSITNGNACYSLEGAVYGVYSDSACTQLVTTLTTDAQGRATSGPLAIRQYWVKEQTPPKGFQLDKTPHPVTVGAGATATLEVSDDPASDPVGISLTKIQETENGYLPSLAGAQFTIRYYDTLDADTVADLPATPTRTWVIETRAETNRGVTIYRCSLLDAYKVAGDAFYYYNGIPTIPLGTITIEETKPSTGYTTEGGYINDSTGKPVTDENGIVLLKVLSDDSLDGGAYLNGGNYYTKEESFRYCSVTLNKRDSGGGGLAGTQFTLEIQNPATGKWDLLTTGTADSSGKVVFGDLVFGTYRLTEKKAAEGHSLLAEPIVLELPLTSSPGGDPTYTEDGVNYYCDISIAAVNTAIQMPRAGGLGAVPFLAVGGLALLADTACALIFTKRRKAV